MRPLAIGLVVILSACSSPSIPPPDAAPVDAALPDAALPDAAPVDAALPDAAPVDAAPAEDAALPDAGVQPWSDCIPSSTFPAATTCADWCATSAKTCAGACGPAADDNTYSAYFFDSEAQCLASSIVAAAGCASSFGMEAGSNHTWARCCCE
jgi:hypothetical protein